MGPNFFSNSNYTPNSYSGTSYGTSGGSLGQRLKNLSKNIKILIIVAIAAVILISLFAIIASVRGSQKKANQEQLEEFYEAINNYNIDYTLLENTYNEKIGFSPAISLKNDDIEVFSSTPVIYSMYFTVEDDLENLKTKYQEKKDFLSDRQKQNYDSLLNIVEKRQEIINNNLYILTGFYGATLKGFVNGSEFCEGKQHILTELIESNNEKISSAATAYASYFCALSNAIDEESFKSANSEKINSTINDLNDGLQKIEIYEEDVDVLISNILGEKYE